jgi:GT2 family glycosyltransferase
VTPFLAALGALEHRPLEIVVVDSGSDDGTKEALARASCALPLRVERLDANVGFAAGMNRALGLTSAAWILALNADTRPEPDLVGALVARATSAARQPIGAVTGRLTRLEPPDLLDACGMYLTWAWRHHDRGSGVSDRGQWTAPERVFGATGAAVLLRRDALDDVAVAGEVFAEEFHSYREDAELAFRLRERGWEIVYEPTAKAAHRRGATPGRRRHLPAEVNFHSLKNRYLLRIYHQGALNFLYTLLPTLGRDLAALAYVILFERTSLAAYSWLWRHRREIVVKRRRIRARRSVPRHRVDRWFWTRGLPT